MKETKERLAKIAGDFLSAPASEYKRAMRETPVKFVREVRALAGCVLTQYESESDMCVKPKGGKKGGKGGKGK